MEIEGRQFSIGEGTDVYGADGEKVGTVVAVEPSYLVVEKGWFFPTDYYIPLSAVASYDDGRAYLSVTKDAALNQGWDVRPVETAGYAAETVADTGLATGATRVAGDETIRVPVYEEELTATTRERERGAVRIEKDVIAEERTLEVPVTEERVRVERRVVDRPIEAGEVAFEGTTIEVPVRGEEVDVQKRARVAEEVEIAKEAVQRTETVADTVRREQVRVHDATTGERLIEGSTDPARDVEPPV